MEFKDYYPLYKCYSVSIIRMLIAISNNLLFQKSNLYIFLGENIICIPLCIVIW